MAVALLVIVARWSLAAPSQVSPSLPVERVRVAVETAAPLPAPLRARIEASVARVAERIVLGKAAALVQENKAEYERVLSEVFGRILVGYRLDELYLAVGPEVRIVLRLSPDGGLVRQVETALAAPGLPEGGLAILEREFQTRRAGMEDIFLGVPLKALAWAEPVLLGEFEEYLREEFPGFRPEIAVGEAAERLELRLTMTPLQPVVGRVSVDISSDDLPRMMVGLWQERVYGHLKALEGIPVAFLRHHQVGIENLGTSWLNADPRLDKLGLDWEVKLYPGITTQARISVATSYYSFTAHGRLEIVDPPILGLGLRSGVRPLAGWELAGEVLLDTSGMDPDWRGSIIRTVAPELSFGLTYTTREGGSLVWCRFASGRGDLFVLGGNLETEEFSATIGLMVETEFTITLTVDSDRRYCLAVQVGL